MIPSRVKMSYVNINDKKTRRKDNCVAVVAALRNRDDDFRHVRIPAGAQKSGGVPRCQLELVICIGSRPVYMMWREYVP